MDIPEATIRDLIEKELADHVKPKEALKRAKSKLHNIVADYLGDPDYQHEMATLTEVFAQHPSAENEKKYCQRILETHASSRERMPHLDVFYQKIFAVTGKPKVILDLACALHPFSFPWMELPNSTQYHAYDIHQPRLNLINHYFQSHGMLPLAENKDILLHPPQDEADVAFIFKETHRMEKRERGCSRPLWMALNCKWLVITLPSASLTGQHDLGNYHRRMVMEIIGDLPWKIVEHEVGNEIIFCMQTRP